MSGKWIVMHYKPRTLIVGIRPTAVAISPFVDVDFTLYDLVVKYLVTDPREVGSYLQGWSDAGDHITDVSWEDELE